MKNKKNNNENVKPQQASIAPDDEMEELDADALKEYTGAGNPFANRPRVGLQSIDSDLRNNG